MNHLFGYLLRDATPDRIASHAQYARTQAAHGSLEHDTACCAAEHVSLTNGALVALKGRPFWRGAAVDSANAAQILDDIRSTHRDRGPDVTTHLQGHFALAIVLPAERTGLLAIDRMGVERMAHATTSHGIIFGTSARAVAGLAGGAIRDQALYDFLFMHMVPAPETVYEGVAKLPPAHRLSYVDGKADVRRYWAPSYEYSNSFSELQVGLKDSLTTAVATAGVTETTGAFLSGGLDSSTVAGVLAAQSTRPAKTFTVGFAADGYDEMAYARISSRHFSCQAHEYYVTPKDIVAVFMRIAATYDEPFGNSSAVPTYYCAKLAADHGVDHLLAGDGGDEIFAGNERYAKQQVFELYGRLPAAIRRLLVSLSGASGEHSPWPLRKIKSYVDQASLALPDRFETWNFTYREGRSRLLDPDFAASIDKEAPLRRLRSVWSSAPSNDLIEKMLWYDWHFTLADNDLRKVGTMCDLAGVRVSYPMLHPDVVDLSTRVPPSMKMRRTELRSFFRRAMTGFLSAETLQKKKHGFGLPFGLWLKTDRELFQLIYGLLANLKQRRIISAKFIDDLVEEHRSGHASYYGYIVWSLAMLEAWLEQQTSSQRVHSRSPAALSA